MSTFEQATEKAKLWIKDMMHELGTDEPRDAYRALGASLHALRDRLGVEEAAQLAAQLPLLVRGLFYEGWHPSSTPIRVRRPDELLLLVDQRASGGRGIDPERALAATFEVLRRHVSVGEFRSLANVLPPSLADLAR